MSEEDNHQEEVQETNKTQSEKVYNFQKKIGASSPKPIKAFGYSCAVCTQLDNSAQTLIAMSKNIFANFKLSGDQRSLRAHLLLEELGELLKALSERDEVELLDALADLQYICVGTATTFDLPIEAAFDAVHESNMTKNSNAAAHDPTTDKGKDENFVPVNLHEIIKSHRNQGEKRHGH